MIINRSDTLGVFQFEENVNTLDVNGTNGTISGTTTYANSISGKGFDFDGSTRINVGNAALSNASNLTIFLRMNIDTHALNDRIIAKRNSGSLTGFEFYVYNDGVDGLRFQVRNAANTSFVTCSITGVTELNPYAVRLEIKLTNEITFSYYTLAGVYVTASTPFTDATYTSNAHTITIGNYSNSSNGCDGLIDDVIIVTSILSDDEFYYYYLGQGLSDL